MLACRLYGPKAAGTLAARNPSREQPSEKSAKIPASAVRRDMRPSLSTGIGGAARDIEHAMPYQPVARIVGVGFKPCRRASQSECVAPRVHVAAHALPAD